MKHTLNPPGRLDEAISAFSSFWRRIEDSNQYIAAWNVKFDGSPKDLEALAYCEYECGYPCDGYEFSSLIWSQVMVNSTEAQWLDPIEGEYAIGGPDEGWPRFVFFPWRRAIEIVHGSFVQFDGWRVMCDLFLLQALMAGYEKEDLKDLSELCFNMEYSNIQTSSYDILCGTARLLRAARRNHKTGQHGGTFPDPPRV